MFRFHGLYKAFSGDKNKEITKSQGEAIKCLMDLFLANPSFLETILPIHDSLNDYLCPVFRPENYNNGVLCSFFSAG